MESTPLSTPQNRCPYLPHLGRPGLGGQLCRFPQRPGHGVAVVLPVSLGPLVRRVQVPAGLVPRPVAAPPVLLKVGQLKVRVAAPVLRKQAAHSAVATDALLTFVAAGVS
jgi:hypothetical protein